ncbi:MAG: hypothetical protein HRU50_02930 [Winogradskyella sp.]|uniref:hypothetical protein n=1 Tax=Winogradskyella sp. TaxID=1883156 RepID=UPI0025FA08BE|nr:hypothetical protein [Winogradskyella sp.]NRB58877.1 hypothetical protein [Winogradskyella sp.]
MKFTQRLAYYLGGFSIGLIILMFFLNGKEASCDYSPNARTTKNISSKPILYTDKTSKFVDENDLDSVAIVNLIKYGNVDFSRSNTNLDSCKIYVVENSYKSQNLELKLRNCDSTATLIDIKHTFN